ncbi:MAG TPA: DUF418 domain-containing protein [Caldimonas sp.]|nr:DUF418 domain-containing protein [Caldimonas sp.]
MSGADLLPPLTADAAATPPARAASTGPLPARERIVALDILRGVAMLGIFVMNVPGFSHSLFAGAAGMETPQGGIDRAVALGREVLVAGRFNTLFSLLFGIGFALQYARLQATRPHDALLVYVRRLVVLGAIGALHAAFLWSGDVLLVYAVLGFALLPLRRAPDALLLALVAACVAFPAVFDAARPWLFDAGAQAIAAFDAQDLEASNNLAYGEGSFIDAVRETMRMFAWGAGTPLGRWSYALFYAHMASGLFLGVFIGRRGGARRLDTLAARVQWPALALATVLGVLAWTTRSDPLSPPAPAVAFVGSFALEASHLACMAFYAATVVRCARSARGRRWLRPFATTGRMPLTNYLLQTAMGTFVFYHWGLGYWNEAGPAAEVALAIALFALVQWPLSAWWLAHHAHGPLEAAWRRLSYGPSVA